MVRMGATPVASTELKLGAALALTLFSCNQGLLMEARVSSA